jgi:hypothetical protein
VRTGSAAGSGDQAAPPVPSEQAVRQPVNQGPIFSKAGVFTLSAGNISLVRGEREACVVASGDGGERSEPVMVLYRDRATGRTIRVSAQRVVIFLRPQSPEARSGTIAPAFSMESVLGLYAEGECGVTDGQYTLRSPRVYYDVERDKAVMLDAVFWTFDASRDLPLYVRAREIRQESARQFTAKEAMFTNSGFLEPELSIGASSVTITRREREVVPEPGSLYETIDPEPSSRELGSEEYTWLNARGITLRAAGLPIFWWPSYGGDPSQPVLRDLRVENRSGSGAALRARWNAYALLGLVNPKDYAATLLTDVYFERGLGLGAQVDWNGRQHAGQLFAYGIPADAGQDVMKTGARIDADDKFRGMVTAENRFALGDQWTVLAELSAISDARFVDAYFERQGETRREFTNRAVVQRLLGNATFRVRAQGSFHDFVANEWLLQSRGYSVSVLPEVLYARQADDLLPKSNPGLLTHFSEYRAGRYRANFDATRADQRGFDFAPNAQNAFGILPSESIADRLRAQGLTEDWIARADTRQEVTATLKTGAVRVVPFVAARLTAYDNDFAGYSEDPAGNDAVRAWGAGGVRLSTTLQRVWDNLDSRVLDLHRLRHIVEPSATLWAATTNTEGGDIPAYQSDVDNIADGAAVRVGVTQTFQTQRGGAGRWAEVDLLKISTDFVFSNRETDPRTPIGRFFDSRPETSALGDYFVGEVNYRLTDVVNIAGSTVYDFDAHRQDLSTIGVILDHAPNFSTVVDLRYLGPQKSTILGVFGNYRISDKYSLSFSPTYDVTASEFQAFSLGFRRRFSALELGVGVQYNNISGETGLSLSLQPYGARGGLNVEGLGSESPGFSR